MLAGAGPSPHPGQVGAPVREFRGSGWSSFNRGWWLYAPAPVWVDPGLVLRVVAQGRSAGSPLFFSPTGGDPKLTCGGGDLEPGFRSRPPTLQSAGSSLSLQTP